MEWYNDKSLPLRRNQRQLLGRRFFFIELRQRSLKLRLEWSLMDKFTKSIIQNFVGNLCKVNIYKLKLLVLTAKCLVNKWHWIPGIDFSYTGLFYFVILRMILTNKTYKFLNTLKLKKQLPNSYAKLHGSLEHLNKMN